MNTNELTIDTYNRSAQKLAEYFKGIGPRTKDIELALSLAGSPVDAHVVEIGCGDGRDAVEIAKRVKTYNGFDPSSELLKIARAKVPSGNFTQADALSYRYPKDVDVVIAFASLLHVNRDDFVTACQKVSASLRKNGIFLVSLKERDKYEEELQKDDFGQRMFYYYTVGLVKNLAGDAFESVHEDHQVVGHTKWFTLALKKI